MTEFVLFLIGLAVLLTLDVFVWRFVYDRAQARHAPSTEAWMESWRVVERSLDRVQAHLAITILNLSVAACALVFVIVR